MTAQQRFVSNGISIPTKSMCRYLFVVLLAIATGNVVADDFKTTDGKEYKNVKVKRVEPDGIVLISKSGISKIYFTELPKEVQQRFNYDAEKAAAQEATVRSSRKPDAATPANATEPMATSGIEGLAPITVELKNEILNALGMTDRLDALYKRGCNSNEFIAAAVPIEGVFVNLGDKLPNLIRAVIYLRIPWTATNNWRLG